MSDLARLLRYLVQGDKEGKITPVTTLGSVQEFTSQLTSGQPRKSIRVYNNSDSASGEILYGFTPDMGSGESQPIPIGAMIDIPVAAKKFTGVDNDTENAIGIYFMNVNSGEWGDLRVQEIA